MKGICYVLLFLLKRRHTGYTGRLTFLSSYSLVRLNVHSQKNRLVSCSSAPSACGGGFGSVQCCDIGPTKVCRCHHQFKCHHIKKTISPPPNSVDPNAKQPQLACVCQVIGKSSCWQHHWCESLFPVLQHDSGRDWMRKWREKNLNLLVLCWWICVQDAQREMVNSVMSMNG